MENALEQYFLKIDPYTETITRIAANGSYNYLSAQLSARLLGIYNEQPYLDACMMNEEALRGAPYPPAWKYLPTGEIYLGTALWLNISPDGELRTPIMREDNLLDDIEFIGFIEPEIIVFYEKLPYNEDSENDSDTDIMDDDDRPF